MRAIEIQALNHLRHKHEFRLWQPEITPEFWSTLTTRNLWKCISDRFMDDPATQHILVSEMREWVDAHNFKDKPGYWAVLKKMRRLKYRKKDPAVRTFLQRTRFRVILETGISMLGEPNGLQELAAIRDQIDHIARLSTREAVKPVSYFDTAHKRTRPIRTDALPTNISKRFDELCAGGIGLAELHIFLGATNIGKTAMLCNVTAGFLGRGKNVVYLTLDDCNAAAIARRVDQIVLGVPEEKILRRPDVFQKKLAKLRKTYGKLYILDYNDKDVSVLDIRAALENLSDRGVPIDLVAVDYLDVMIGDGSTRDEQKVFLQICRGLKRIGRDLRTRIVTAGQGTRDAIDSDNIKLSQMAGAIAKAKSADVVFGLNQTPDERAEDIMRVTCLRSRAFRRWTDEVWLTTDWATMRLLPGRAAEESDPEVPV